MSIPTHISASRALAREEQYVGRIDSVRLDRLADFSPQDIEAELFFRFDAARFKRVEGRVKGQLSLECQVCLQSYDWQLDAPISLVIVESEDEEARVLADSDPVMVEDDRPDDASDGRRRGVAGTAAAQAMPNVRQYAPPKCGRRR